MSEKLASKHYSIVCYTDLSYTVCKFKHVTNFSSCLHYSLTEIKHG